MLKAENDPRIEQEDYKFSKRIAAKLVQDHGPAPDSAEPEFAAPSSNAQQEPAAVAHKRKLGDDVTDSGQPAKSAKRSEEDMDVDQVNRVLELSSFNLCDASVKNKILKAVVDKRFLATVYHEEVAIKNLKPTELQRQNVKGTIAEMNRLVMMVSRIQHKNGLYFLHEFSLSRPIAEVSRPPGSKVLAGSCARVMRKSGVIKEVAVTTITNLTAGKAMTPQRIDLVSNDSGRTITRAKRRKEVMLKVESAMREDRRIDAVSGLSVFKPEERYWDDKSGKELDPGMIKDARCEEMEEFKKHRVYDKVPLQEALRVTGKKPIGVRWVDVNKGDEFNPEYRSRLVAKEIKKYDDLDLFAATPPWESKKLLLSLAVTKGFGWHDSKKTGYKLDFIDVRRAYFHAKARRSVYVELPPEDQEPGMCGRLNMSMYGTRDAAQNWEFEYSEFLINCGFQAGQSVVCLFYHEVRDIRIAVHGDDFTVLDPADQLDWLRTEITTRFEVKFRGRLGPGHDDDKAIRLLNRIIEWTSEGIVIEGDQRHAEIIIDQLGLYKNSTAVSTPGETSRDEEDHQDEVVGQDATLYRACVARGNFMSQDRSDIQYAVKELSRKMSKPNVGDMAKLKRFGRYLVARPRSIVKLKYQEACQNIEITAFTDTDFAGCRKTRKSTSGGIIMIGKHTLKTWSLTQSVIALSSGEAEYYGMVKGASQAIGFKSMLEDLGIRAYTKVVVKTDANAAIGIASRRGMGKVRHIETNQLWLQHKVAQKQVEVVKIRGEDNPADSLTKYLNHNGINKHMGLTNQVILVGRHRLAPEINS